MFAKILKHCLIEKDMKISELAKLLNTSSQNLSQKIKRDNFSEKEMKQIADLLEMNLIIELK